MIKPVILSNTSSAIAISVFEHWLIKEPVTLLVVLGTDEIAKMAISTAQDLINSNDINYSSLRVIQVPNLSLILEELKELDQNPKMNPFDWKYINDYVIFSISNKFNVIGSFVLKSTFYNHPIGYINRIIRKAQANDVDLSLPI